MTQLCHHHQNLNPNREEWENLKALEPFSIYFWCANCINLLFMTRLHHKTNGKCDLCLIKELFTSSGPPPFHLSLIHSPLHLLSLESHFSCTWTDSYELLSITTRICPHLECFEFKWVMMDHWWLVDRYLWQKMSLILREQFPTNQWGSGKSTTFSFLD